MVGNPTDIDQYLASAQSYRYSHVDEGISLVGLSCRYRAGDNVAQIYRYNHVNSDKTDGGESFRYMVRFKHIGGTRQT